MKTLRFSLAAAVLSVVVAACSGGSPTAPARQPDRPSAAASDTIPSGPATSNLPPNPLPTDPPPDPRQIYGSGT
ncbi:MAG TPA: hypothetical protein VEX86_21690 [Longimicrobium sp.]|nr:hypothetical protein [Longimicrobium sp.]